MKSLEVSVEEIIGALKRSSIPTVLTGGKDDYTAYRFVEDCFRPLEVSLLPVGGKSNLLKLFERRSELPVPGPLFVLDKDLWAIYGVPKPLQECESVTFTQGFSIENDIFIDGNLHNLLSRAEKQRFSEDLNVICEWFAAMLERIKAGETATIKTNPHKILGDQRKMSESFKIECQFSTPQAELYESIRKDFALLLRGKTLLLLLSQHLSRPKRTAKHSFSSLLEIGANAMGPALQNLIEVIGRYHGIQPSNDTSAASL